MAAELSLRFGATEEVSKEAKKAAAGIEGLEKTLDNAAKKAKEAGKEFDQAGGKVVSLSGRVKGLKEPISNVAQLANAMGTAFGGAASKATGLINGVVSGFAGGGAMGLAIGATTGLVSVLIAKFQEAQEAAEKAAAARKEVFETEVDRINALITGYDDLIAKQKNAALGAFDVQKTALEAQAAGAKASLQILEQQRGSLLQGLENFRETLKQRGAYSPLDFEQLGVVKEYRAQIAALNKPIQDQAILIERYTAGLERLDVAASKVGARALGAKIGALLDRQQGEGGGFAGDPAAMLNADLASPEAAAEYASRRQARNVAGNVERIRRDLRVGEALSKDAVKQARDSAKNQAEALKEELRSRLEAQKEMEQAGLAAGLGYLDALGKAIRGDGAGALKSALSALGSVLGFAIGGPLGASVGGGISNFVGGFLRDGGEALQVRVPKARRGMAFVDLDSDGKLIEGHAGEVIWNAPAVAKNGGIDRVARQNNPLEPPMMEQGGRGPVNIYVSSLVATDAAAAVARVIEPGMRRNLSNHQSGLLARELQEAAALPRYE